MAFRMSKMSVSLGITLFWVVSSGKIDLSIKKTWQKLRFLPPLTAHSMQKPTVYTMSTAEQSCAMCYTSIYLHPLHDFLPFDLLRQ